MATSSKVLSQTLHSLTTTKVRELHKQKDIFESRKKAILDRADRATNQQERVKILLKGLLEGQGKSGFTALTHVVKFSLERIERFLEQSHYDTSVSTSMLEGYEAELRQKYSQQSKKYDFADLYSKLLEQWLQGDNDSGSDKQSRTAPVPSVNLQQAASEDAVSLDGSFELVEKDRLQQLKDKFAEVVFTPTLTNADAIDKHLHSLFKDVEAQKVLQKLRDQIKGFGETFTNMDSPFSDTTLKATIRGLLKEDLLSEQKRAVLQDFLQNPIVLNEIADVLNMRFKNLSDWSWDAPDGMIIEPRAQLNGKWRVIMDEDILQAILLHYIALEWSVAMKRMLSDLITSKAWYSNETISREEEMLRYYYLGTTSAAFPAKDNVQKARLDTYKENFFLNHLPNNVEEGGRGYDDAEDDDAANPAGFKSPVEIKQQLLRVLATEAVVQRFLYGRVAVVQSDLKWYATSLPHSTIFAVWKFLGLSDFWAEFFRKFLEPPIQMSDNPEKPERVRIRQEGVQMATAFEQLFGEIVLFPLDLAVNRGTNGLLLYRIHDDLWLCGDPVQVGTGWQIMKDYNMIMGLEFNDAKTGSVHIHEKSSSARSAVELPPGDVRVGFLKLEVNGDWVIDQRQVTMHAKQLKKQLAGAPSVFAWVQTWNSCMGRFFNMTFGEPANCFGRPHVDSILQTHTAIHKELFGNQSVTDHLRNIIASHFGVYEIPNAFIFFSEELGGLGLRNPFIKLLVVRDSLPEGPIKYMQEYEERERERYRVAKAKFDALTPHERRRRANMHHGGEPYTDFMSFDDFTKDRERYSALLHETYTELMQKPPVKDITLSSEVQDAVYEASREQYMKVSGGNQDSEQKWMIQLYSNSVMDTFGGLAIVDKALLPLGVMTMLREKKVTWQAVL